MDVSADAGEVAGPDEPRVDQDEEEEEDDEEGASSDQWQRGLADAGDSDHHRRDESAQPGQRQTSLTGLQDGGLLGETLASFFVDLAGGRHRGGR